MSTTANTIRRVHPAAVEFKKGRRLRLFLIPLGFLLVVFLWAVYSDRNLDSYERAQGYTYLFFQMPLLNCMFMPVMIAVIASRLGDMEIKGQTLKLLYTLQEKTAFYDLKYLHEAFYLLLFTLGEVLIIPLCGMLSGYTETLSVSLLIRHAACTLAAGCAVLTLQHLLSLCSGNQIVPLIVGLAGSFLGLFSIYFPQSVSKFILWYYFAAFLPYSMDYNEVTRQMSFEFLPLSAAGFTGFLVFCAVFYFVCRSIFLRREV